ncbi:Pentatricopeptide repeat-containing protein [Quillaja saponaria]|uniref:Pentatricopeptide repeat-containing protein n=1 Tax=Quillaja saponaria TaxID=32244 RepID=A0AAD7PWT3_QUISA|nr:Pentatricopeptide repeat-containing protein [Quillaja saponaria]
MSDMAREGITPNVVTYNTSMAIYLEQGEAAESLALLAYRRMEDGNGALNFFIEFRDKQNLSLVWACTCEEYYNVAIELYGKIRERYTEISLSVCNHVIWLMDKAKKWWAALEIYEDLLDKGPQPNKLSYELIISHFNVLLQLGKEEFGEGVSGCQTRAKEKGLKPGSREWNVVLVACSKASETTAVVQISKRMVEQGEKPTIISYGALLSALEKGKTL